MQDSRLSKRLRFALCLLAGLLLVAPGCVRRRLLVRSNPPGATVYVDNQPIGHTPCSTDFTYYGTREIRLVKAGFETLTVNQPIPTPWYEIPPLDFVSENLVPRKVQDYRTVSYDLTPQVIVPTEQLIERGQQLRETTLQGSQLPITPAPLPGTPLPPPTINAAPNGAALPPGGLPVELLPPPRVGK